MSLVFAFYLAGLNGKFKPTPDSCEYLGLGQSLAQAKGYQFNGQNGSRYPFLLPAILAGLNLASVKLPGSISLVCLAKLTQIVWVALLTLGAWRLALHYLTARQARIVALLVPANIFIFQHTMFIVSDVPYACLSIWTLVCLVDKRGFFRVVLGVMLLGLTWSCRSVGIFLAAAVVLGALFGKWQQVGRTGRWARAILVPALAAIPFVIWKLYYAGPAKNYLVYWLESNQATTWWGKIWGMLREFAPRMPLRCVQLTLNIEGITLPYYFAVILFAVVIIGWWVCFKQRRCPVEWYALIYLAALAVWPFEQGVRLYLPLLPLFMVYGMVGVEQLRQGAAGTGYKVQLIRLVIGAALVVLMLPLALYVVEHLEFARPMELLRGGYIYCLGAVVILAAGLLWYVSGASGPLVGRVAVGIFLAIYVGMGLLYMGGYALLERGLIKSRGPMLAGYEPYVKMGRWLGNQSAAAEPVLCAQVAIVHWAGGKITREPAVSIKETLKKLQAQEYRGVLVLEPTPPEILSEDEHNRQLRKMVKEHPDKFRQVSEGAQNGDYRYHLYIIRAADER